MDNVTIIIIIISSISVVFWRATLKKRISLKLNFDIFPYRSVNIRDIPPRLIGQIIHSWQSLKEGKKLLLDYILDYIYGLKRYIRGRKRRFRRALVRKIKELLGQEAKATRRRVRLFFDEEVSSLRSLSRMRRIQEMSHGIYADEGRVLKFEGSVCIPRRVYEGDSHVFSLELVPHVSYHFDKNPTVELDNDKDKLSLTISWHKECSLKVSLVSPAMAVKNIEKEQQSLGIKSLSFGWHCYFPNSGDHIVVIAVDLYGKPGEESFHQKHRVERRIKVVRIDHLTKRQVWVLASIGSLAALALTAAKLVMIFTNG